MSVASPQFMKKIHTSLYGTVRFTVPAAWCFDCCAHAHIGSCTLARSGEKHCCSCSADPGVLVEGSFFFTPRVLCLLIFSRKLEEEEWISFLNEYMKLEL
jgi:hypothetical protein